MLISQQRLPPLRGGSGSAGSSSSSSSGGGHGLHADDELAEFAGRQPQPIPLKEILEMRETSELQRALEMVARKSWSKIRWPHSFTALHLAAEIGSSEVVRYLLAATAAPSLQTRDAKGRTPLDIAKKHAQPELEELLARQSAYGDGPLEGIYLRMDEPEEDGGGLWLRQRGKIVRADFIQGIEEGGHFINKQVVRNRLAG